MSAPNGLGSAALPCTELVYTLTNDVPGQVPFTMPCWMVFEPVM